MERNEPDAISFNFFRKEIQKKVVKVLMHVGVRRMK